jgi:hypothetical protein
MRKSIQINHKEIRWKDVDWSCLTQNRDNWLASRPGHFILWERARGTHWIGGWVGPSVGLDDVEKQNSWPYRDSHSEPSVFQPAASRYTDWAISAPHSVWSKLSKLTCPLLTLHLHAGCIHLRFRIADTESDKGQYKERSYKCGHTIKTRKKHKLFLISQKWRDQISLIEFKIILFWSVTLTTSI